MSWRVSWLKQCLKKTILAEAAIHVVPVESEAQQYQSA